MIFTTYLETGFLLYNDYPTSIHFVLNLRRSMDNNKVRIVYECNQISIISGIYSEIPLCIRMVPISHL